MDNIGYRIYLLSIQTNPCDLFTQKDLPPICEHLIQINQVSLDQECSALVNTQVFTVNIPIFRIAEVPDFQNLLS